MNQFNDISLVFFKLEILKGGNPNNRDELAQALSDFLNRIDNDVLANRKLRHTTPSTSSGGANHESTR